MREADDKPQVARFKEAACALGCDKSEAAFDEKLKEIAKAKPKVEAPIACTPGASDYQERMRWITDLNRTASKADRLYGLTLTLSYAEGAGRSPRWRILFAVRKHVAAF